jgi:hypothetical protein
MVFQRAVSVVEYVLLTRSNRRLSETRISNPEITEPLLGLQTQERFNVRFPDPVTSCTVKFSGALILMLFVISRHCDLPFIFAR